MATDFFFRRNLPHWRPPGVPLFITYCLSESLPQKALDELERERQILINLSKDSATDQKVNIDKKLFAIWDQYLDKDNDKQWLADPKIAKVIQENIYHHLGEKYLLWAYVIMPNHVHILLQPTEKIERQFSAENNDKPYYGKDALSVILHSLRSYTANKANKLLGRSGRFWHPEAYDHWVRNDDELHRIIYYIENNPVKAGLAKSPEDWHFSSAYARIKLGLGPFDKIPHNPC